LFFTVFSCHCHPEGTPEGSQSGFFGLRPHNDTRNQTKVFNLFIFLITMKKILSILILTVLMVGLIAPVAVLAQKEKLKDCCVIRQAMSWKKGKVGTTNCTAAAPCPLEKNKTIGQKDGTACPTPADANAKVDYYSDSWGMVCIVSMITSVTNWIFYIMMVAVVIVFVIAGAMFMMAGGSTEKTKTAKGMMILGIVGLVIALVAKLIPSVVRLIVGV